MPKLFRAKILSLQKSTTNSIAYNPPLPFLYFIIDDLTVPIIISLHVPPMLPEFLRTSPGKDPFGWFWAAKVSSGECSDAFQDIDGKISVNFLKNMRRNKILPGRTHPAAQTKGDWPVEVEGIHSYIPNLGILRTKNIKSKA